MSKKPRPSINDQLAQIAAKASSTSNVSTLPREDAGTLERDDVASLRRDDMIPDHLRLGRPAGAAEAEVGPDGYKRRVRFEKPHASVYAHPKVFKALREIAAAQDCKPHDLYLEGLRLVLKAHGRDFDALNRGE